MNKLVENNQIYLDKYSGWYSIRDEAFYSENEIIDGKAPSGSESNGLKNQVTFLNFHLGKIIYKNFIKKIQIL